MNKSIVFFILLFFLSSGFVNHDKPTIEDGGQQREFLEFLSHFEKVSLPYSVDLKNYEQSYYSKAVLKSKNNPAKINKAFDQFANKFIPAGRMGKFSRMGRPILRPIARYYPNDQTVAIIYTSKIQFTRNISSDYHIAYYDLRGNLLGNSKKKSRSRNDIRIGFTNQHHVQTFTILPSGKIKTTFYDNHWKQKVGSVPHDQNELLGFKKVKTIDYEYSTSKGFQEIAQVASARP